MILCRIFSAWKLKTIDFSFIMQPKPLAPVLVGPKPKEANINTPTSILQHQLTLSETSNNVTPHHAIESGFCLEPLSTPSLKGPSYNKASSIFQSFGQSHLLNLTHQRASFEANMTESLFAY